MPISPKTVLLVHLAATLYMVGLIWFVQGVHYPLFGRVGEAGFIEYARLHSARTTWVVAPPMLLELATALLLLVTPPRGVRPVELWVGLALLVLIWLSTAFLQVPRHTALAAGFDPAVHRALVLTNWLRTLAWTARGALVLLWIGRRL